MTSTIASVVSGSAFWLFGLWAIAYGMSKREDVPWRQFLLAGPLLFVQPSRFVREHRLRLVNALGLATFACFVAGWMLTWAGNNHL